MPRSKRVTHRDVARLAGVSPAVVSYVVNGGPRGVAPETAERVLRAIEELDYHPNAFARGLRARRTHTVGYVVDDFNPLDVFISPYSAGILTGLTAELKSRGYYLLIYPIAIGEGLSRLEELLRSGRLDAVVVRLVQDPPETDPLLELIADTGVPCICIEQAPSERFGFGSVGFDDESGARRATLYLLQRGHRRVAHLAGDLKYATARARLEGYKRALAESGVPFDERLVEGGQDWDPSLAIAGTRRLLDLPEPPTAILAANDSLAVSAMGLLHREGYRVPEDVALIGFDDVPLAQEVDPPLTTVRIPLAEIGHRAAQLAVQGSEADGDRRQPREVLSTELVRRGSA